MSTSGGSAPDACGPDVVVLRGAPDAVELAALVAVLAARGAPALAAPVRRPGRPGWTASAAPGGWSSPAVGLPAGVWFPGLSPLP